MLQQHVQSLAFYLLLHRLKDGLAGSTSKYRAPAEQHNRTFPFTWKGQKKTTLKLNCMEFAIHVKLQDVFSTLKLRRFFLHLHEVWWVLFYPGLHLTENQKFHAGDIESETSTNTFAVIAPTRQGSRPEGWYLGGSIGAVLSRDQLASAMDNLRFENYAS